MQLGMIGLGRMGANMVRRLLRAGHQCVVYDRSPQAEAWVLQEWKKYPAAFWSNESMSQMAPWARPNPPAPAPAARRGPGLGTAARSMAHAASEQGIGSARLRPAGVAQGSGRGPSTVAPSVAGTMENQAHRALSIDDGC
jgi:hypothetical protein